MVGPLRDDVGPATDTPAKFVKWYHDRKLRFVADVKPGQFVFVDRAPTTSKKTPKETRIKLLPKSAGPFEVIEYTPETLTIEEDGLTNVNSVDRITLAANIELTHVTMRLMYSEPLN